jgi:hypothetical protein
MRWLVAALLVAALFMFDRIYLGGQNAELLLSLLRQIARAISVWAEDMVRSIRR